MTDAESSRRSKSSSVCCQMTGVWTWSWISPEGCRQGRCPLWQTLQARAVSPAWSCPGRTEAVVMASTAQIASSATDCRIEVMGGAYSSLMSA
jgi:hypothetical protein